MKAKKMFNKIGYSLKKNASEILLGVGITGTLGTVVLASKATLGLPALIEDYTQFKYQADMAEANMEIPYTEEDRKRDMIISGSILARETIKLYLPSIVLGAVSIGCILESHKILRNRALALGAAYATLDAGFKAYKERVAEVYGEDAEKDIRYGVSKEIVTSTETDENGKKKKVKSEVSSVDDAALSPYSKFFDASNENFEKDPEFNLQFIRSVQNQANDLLKARGHVFLNEVYDRLGIPRTKAGQVVGWVLDYDEDAPGDNYIDFGIFNTQRKSSINFVNGYESTILLDFNVDGSIWDRDFVEVR